MKLLALFAAITMIIILSLAITDIFFTTSSDKSRILQNIGLTIAGIWLVAFIIFMLKQALS